MGLFHEELKGAVPKMTVILQTARDIAAGLEHVHGHHNPSRRPYRWQCPPRFLAGRLFRASCLHSEGQH